MGRILEALAADAIAATPPVGRETPEARRVRERFDDLGEALMTRLGAEERKLLDDYTGAFAQENALYSTGQFVRGYRLGALMMLELLFEGDDLVLGEGEV